MKKKSKTKKSLAKKVFRQHSRVSKKPRAEAGWKVLTPGDVVDVIAPGFAPKGQDIEATLSYLSDLGLKARVPHDLFGEDILCSNSDAKRFGHLRAALLSEDSRAVWCVRGGYGSNRLIPRLLELDRKLRSIPQPKLFVGLSDISTLLIYLQQRWKWPVVHGPMLDRLGKKIMPEVYQTEMRRFAFGEIRSLTFENLEPMNEAARKARVVRGTVTGGNLITLQSSLGTALEWNTERQIIFIEEIGERAYRIDRALEHCVQCGLLNHAKAVIFGDFTECREPDGVDKTQFVLQRFADSLKIPVLRGIQSGHGEIQRPLPLGTASTLNLGESGGRLVCATGGR